MPPMPVEAVTLAAKPVPQSSEFVGTVKSLQSISVKPQAEGFLTRVVVKSGDRVRAEIRDTTFARFIEVIRIKCVSPAAEKSWAGALIRYPTAAGLASLHLTRCAKDLR
jgi:hypothetical protein